MILHGFVKLGTRQVADLMQVDRYSHIMHLVSRVVGKLRPELDALHAYQACMNMGTLTGAPKLKQCNCSIKLNNKNDIQLWRCGRVSRFEWRFRHVYCDTFRLCATRYCLHPSRLWRSARFRSAKRSR